MKHWKSISCVALLAAMVICGTSMAALQATKSPKPAPKAAPKPAPKGGSDAAKFVPLCNGKDFSEFTPRKAPASIWTLKDGVIQCKGKPFGWLETKKSYRNYVLKLEMRYPKEAGNSGIFLHIGKIGKKWPKCIEVQGKFVDMCKIFGLGGTKGTAVPGDAKARTKAQKKHTEWNAIEITVKDGAITATLNGTLIGQSKPFDITEGPIGLQSEGAPVEFRKLQIKELPAPKTAKK